MDGYTIFMLVLLGLFALMLVMSAVRKKKVAEQTSEMRADLKKGDKVMTDSGIVGEIMESYEEEGYKYFVLKTGKNENVSFFTVHANAIYYVFGKENLTAPNVAKEIDTPKVEDQPETQLPKVEETIEAKKEPTKKKNTSKKK